MVHMHASRKPVLSPQAHAGSGAPLVPANPYAAARVKLFSLYFAEHVVPAYAHLVAATEPAAIADAREALMRALAAGE